jgi:hypothetical protein
MQIRFFQLEVFMQPLGSRSKAEIIFLLPLTIISLEAKSQWLLPVILATQEAEIRRTTV